MMTFMKARFAQQYRDQVRKHTRDAMRQKAEQGYVTGGRSSATTTSGSRRARRRATMNEAEAAVVRDIYERFAAGDGARTIALALNRAGHSRPARSRDGRTAGQSSTVRAVLDGRSIVARWSTAAREGATAASCAQAHGTREGAGRRSPKPRGCDGRSSDLRIVDADLARASMPAGSTDDSATSPPSPTGAACPSARTASICSRAGC